MAGREGGRPPQSGGGRDNSGPEINQAAAGLKKTKASLLKTGIQADRGAASSAISGPGSYNRKGAASRGKPEPKLRVIKWEDGSESHVTEAHAKQIYANAAKHIGPGK